MGHVLKILIVALFFFFFGYINFAETANPLDVVINEIAWMGTSVSYNDEWIELYNKTDSPINLDGWVLKAADGAPEIKLTGNIVANGFCLLERSKDYTGALENGGEILELYDDLGNLIDKIDASSGWPAGDNETKQTMERSLAAPGAANWQTSQNPGGTPMAENSKVAEDGPPQVSPTTTEKSYEVESYEVEPRKLNHDALPFLAAIFTSFSSGVMILILKRKTHVRA